MYDRLTCWSLRKNNKNWHPQYLYSSTPSKSLLAPVESWQQLRCRLPSHNRYRQSRLRLGVRVELSLQETRTRSRIWCTDWWEGSVVRTSIEAQWSVEMSVSYGRVVAVVEEDISNLNCQNLTLPFKGVYIIIQ
jgi:hypothetical protein